MRKPGNGLKRRIASLLAMVMLCTSADFANISTLNAFAMNESIGENSLDTVDTADTVRLLAANSATSYADTLNGWTVDCKWDDLDSNSATVNGDVCQWSPSYDGKQQFKMSVTYEIHTSGDVYQPGDIIFRIPGIGLSSRDSVVKASSVAAYDTQGEDPEDLGQEWEYTWDRTEDIYTFKNRFEIQTQSQKGGFQIIWTLSSRDTENGYTQTKSPSFSISDTGSGTNTITLEPLTFEATTIRDHYRISMEQKITGSEYGSLDEDYYWKKYITRVAASRFSRGLNQSTLYTDITLPDGLTEDDLLIYLVDGSLTEPSEIKKMQDEDGNPFYRVYLFENRYGDLSTGSEAGQKYTETFFVGIKKHETNGENELLGKYFTVKTHLDRKYQDEETWLTDDTEATDHVTESETFTLDDYSFVYQGFIYHIWKNTSDGYAASDSISAPEQNADRLLDSHLYDNTMVTFSVQGTAKRSYEGGDSDGGLNLTPNRLDNALSAEPSTEEKARAGKTYGEIYGSATVGGNTSGTSLVEEKEAYSMIIGDDCLGIELKDGTIREMRGDEYEFAYVTMPGLSNGRYYEYEIYGSAKEDRTVPDSSSDASDFDDFVCLAVGNTSVEQVFKLPKGYSSIFVRINNIVGNFDYIVYYKVRLHLDVDEQNRLKEENSDKYVQSIDGKITNCSYLRAMITRDGKEINDDGQTLSNYGDGFSLSHVAEEDITYHREYLHRNYSKVWIRPAETMLSVSAGIDGNNASSKQGYDAQITAKGTIRSETEGNLECFSLYSTIPDGFQFDSDEMNPKLTAIGDYLDGSRADLDFADHVTYSTRQYTDEIGNKHTMLVADFDFSDDPLMINNITSITISYPVHMSLTDYVMNGNTYTTSTYLMVHDSGVTSVDYDSNIYMNSGKIDKDVMNLDEDTSTSESLAVVSATKEYLDEAISWREFVSKYVKTAYNGGYSSEGAVRRSVDDMTDERREQSEYNYRLDFGLGTSSAKNIWFFDSIEQGAMIAENDLDPYVYKGIGSAWQGQFLSVDTTYAKNQKLSPTVYFKYSSDPLYHFKEGEPMDQREETVRSPFDTGSQFENGAFIEDGWTKMTETLVMEDGSADKAKSDLWTIPDALKEDGALAIAIHFDTTEHGNKGVLASKEMTYALINMLAPTDEAFDEKKAVNQYYVQYDYYVDPEDENTKTTYTLPSSQTYVEPMEDVGKIILAKVDGDHVTVRNEKKYYQNLTEAVFRIYRLDETEDGTEVTIDGKTVKLDYEHPHVILNEKGEEDREVNTTGRIVMKNLPPAYYLYEEVKAPRGYLPTTLSQEERTFYLTSETGTIHVENSRIETKVVLTKEDEDRKELGPVPGAVYELTDYQSNQIYLLREDDGIYRYKADADEADLEMSFVTGYGGNADGQDASAAVSTLVADAKGRIVIYDLPWGNYRFVEKKAPDGYEISEELLNFTVNRLDSELSENGKLYLVHYIEAQDKEKTASVVLKKIDEATQNPLKNTYYDLYYEEPDGSGNWVIAKDKDGAEIEAYHTNTSGELRIDNLLFGHYKFVETQATPGYKRPADPAGDGAVYFTLDASTAETTVERWQTNAQILGQMNIRKTSENGNILTGAVFQLYKKGADGEDDQLIRVDENYKVSGEGTIDRFSTQDNGVTRTISGLSWGDYYIKEITAPKGYEKDDTAQYAFSINQNNASESASVTVDVADRRIRGSVLLTKKDDKGNVIGRKADDANYDYTTQFRLYTTGNEAIGYSSVDPDTGAYVIEEEKDLNGDGEINDEDNNNPLQIYTTNQSGQILVTGLDWGSYYFREIKAPEGFGISDSYVRFSINQGNAASRQQLECKDKENRARLVIRKKINDWYKEFGSPTFIFKISGTDTAGVDHDYTRALTLGSLKEDSIELNVPEGTYTVKEQTASRYRFYSVSGTNNVTTDDGLIAHVTLTGGTTSNPAYAEVIFENRMKQYEELSHTGTIINEVVESKKPTSLSVEYTGPEPISSMTERGYTFSEDDLKAIVYYDDNTSQEVDFDKLTLSPEMVTGDDNGGMTVQVSYTEGGITVTDSFNVDIQLKNPIREHHVTFHAGEGSFTGGQTNEISVRWKEETQPDASGTVGGENELVEGTYEVPEKESKAFAGWYLDENLTTPYTAIGEDGIPTEELTADLDLYAKFSYAKITYVLSFKDETDQEVYQAGEYIVTEYKNFENGVNVPEDGYKEPDRETLKLEDEEEIGPWYIYDPETEKITGILNLKKPISGDLIVVGSKITKSVKYAVSIYGIEEDVIADGFRAGLTFGPATGENYNDSYRSHEPTGKTAAGNDHRCLHDDGWETIIEWANKDPYVYEQCVAAPDMTGYAPEDEELAPRYSCTKSVQMTHSTREKVMNDTIFSQSGDGAGVLYDSINFGYSLWNQENVEDNTGGWPVSRIRAVLNGAQSETADGVHNKTLSIAGEDIAELTIDESLFGAFPQELQEAIVRKKVKSDVVYNDALTPSYNITTYDRLWLFAGAELWESGEGFNEEGFGTLGGDWNALRKQEGLELGRDNAAYSRQRLLEIYDYLPQNLSKMTAYTETTGSGKQFWLRTLARDQEYVYLCDNQGGAYDASTSAYYIGIAPGFCIGEIE